MGGLAFWTYSILHMITKKHTWQLGTSSAIIALPLLWAEIIFVALYIYL